MVRLADVLQVLLPALPEALADEPSRRRLLGLGARLPAYPEGLFECGLGAHEIFDMSVAVTRDTLAEHPWLSTALDAAPSGAASLWHEFDLDRWDSNPSTFVRFASTPGLAYLAGAWDPGAARTLLEQAFAVLPAPAEPRFLGRMARHRRYPWRLTVGPFTPEDGVAWLEAIGWPGNTATAQGLLELACEHGADHALALDLGQTWGATLGLECFDGADTLLGDAVARGLCPEERREALVRWPGTTVPGDTPWPAHLVRASVLAGSDRLSVFQRNLNHVKLIASPDGALSAKAYLGWRHDWGVPRAP